MLYRLLACPSSTSVIPTVTPGRIPAQNQPIAHQSDTAVLNSTNIGFSTGLTLGMFTGLLAPLTLFQ